MVESSISSLFWLLSFGAIGWMFLKFREAQRVLVNANPAAHLTDLEARLQIARDELARWELARQQIEPTKIELEKLLLRRQAILDEISSIEGQKQNLLQELQSLDPEKQQLDETRQAHAKAMEELADARQRHSEVLKETEVMKAVLAGLQETKQRTEEIIGRQENRVSQLYQQTAASETQLIDMARRIDAQRHELELGDKRLAQLREECSRLEAASTQIQGEIKDLTGNADMLRVSIKGLLETKQKTEQEIAQQQIRANQLEQEIATLEANVVETARRLNASKHDLQSTEERLAALRQEYSKTQAAREKAYAEIKEFEAKTEALRKCIGTYEAALKGLHTEFAKRAGTEAVEPSKVLEDLAAPVLGFNFSGPVTLDESGALQRLSEYLASKGLQYPERVQRAFHTSLKASQINPLVVLAGVSGTGKSALPMAYAEALGINFVSLAVQPGWSGPQDLLGFYNYLEKKYKATDLARAIAQMSQFSSVDLQGLKIESRKEQMLLLLLDEMNLARIEYYFSDFLSRLEQRRGRNVNDAQRRREVALHLDIGSLPSNEASRFIFPDFNVLFVGTMNEDESTQSLSDKVVDRANVLRFGAPKTLHAATANTSTPSKNFLPRVTWESWLKAFDSDTYKVERKLLSDINGQLEKINRPFGHRVFRAILDYISNYPGIAIHPERRDHAMADQIEQKIIPKLRGLDTQDDAVVQCLQYLSERIAELKDPELRDAFNRARSGHMFEWFGVKRS